MKEVEPRVIGLYCAENALTSIRVDREGVIGSKYHGAFTTAGVREDPSIRGSEIRNRRQITGIDVSELREIAKLLELPYLTATNLRPDIVFEGIPRLTQLPPGTMLRFPSGTVLEVEGFNDPCSKPAKYIVSEHQNLDYGTFKEQFKQVAKGRRGIIASVYRTGEGVINLGDRVEIEEYKPQPIKLSSI